MASSYDKQMWNFLSRLLSLNTKIDTFIWLLYLRVYMSHTFGNINGKGDLGKGDFSNNLEDVHLRLHHYYGGEKKGSKVNLSIDVGHQYDLGSSYGSHIDLDRESVVFLVNQLTKWLGGFEGSDDCGTQEEFTIKEVQTS